MIRHDKRPYLTAQPEIQCLVWLQYRLLSGYSFCGIQPAIYSTTIVTRLQCQVHKRRMNIYHSFIPWRELSVAHQACHPIAPYFLSENIHQNSGSDEEPVL